MRLYKYCDAGGIEVLRSCSIKVTSPLELNDPFDCMPVPDTWTTESREALKRQIESKSAMYQHLQAGIVPAGMPAQVDLVDLSNRWEASVEASVNNPEEVMNSMKEAYSNLAILCLSAEKSHPLMWAHYADGHRGLVIELETDGLFGLSEDRTITNRLIEVQYSSERPVFRFDGNSYGAFTTKGETWNYEHEWRVIYLKNRIPAPRVVCGRAMHLRPIPPTCFKAVYFGCQMPASHREEVMHLLKQEHLRHIGVFQLNLDPKEFHLVETAVDSGLE